MADLREASLTRKPLPGSTAVPADDLADATHHAIREAIRHACSTDDAPLDVALSAVEKGAMPRDRFEGQAFELPRKEAAAAAAGDARSFHASRARSKVARAERVREWRRSFRETIEHLSDPSGTMPEGTAARLPAFGGMHVPLGMEDIFDEEVERALSSVPRLS